MKYCSTRGAVTDASFEDVVMGGLAPDRGLYVPQSVPQVSSAELSEMRSMKFHEVAYEILGKFIDEDEMPDEDLRDILKRSFSTFRHEDVTPLVQVGDTPVLELFHGPTFAFKDVALQFLGNLFEYFLKRRKARGDDAKLCVLGATSGDTGSAAISGLRGKEGVECFILFPDGKVSPIQERQMTTIEDSNVHCIAIDGNFDDCQDLVKAAQADAPFKAEMTLGAVNSINWARVLAQTVYYYWSWLRFTDTNRSQKLNFSVPTGNFGDILAGHYAKRMGLPVGKLLVATNENDILDRFFSRGEYHREVCVPTLAPSMDISVSSNFERLLFFLAGDDAAQCKAWMDEFETTKKLTVGKDVLKKTKDTWCSAACSKDEILNAMRQCNADNEYLLCPHSAIGLAAVTKAKLNVANTVVLATAHADKFPAAVEEAIGQAPVPHPLLKAVLTKPTRRTDLPNSLADLEALMRKRVAAAAAGGKGGAYGGQAMYTLPIVAVTVLLPCAMLWFKHGKFPM